MVMPASCLILFPYTTLFRSFLHREDADHAAGLVVGLHVDDPLATARRESIILQRSALAVAVFGDGQDEAFFLDHLHPHQIIVRIEAHRADAARLAAHAAHVFLVEADRLAFVRPE